MSLFERLKNKRYDLQESGPNKPEFYNKKTEQQFQGSVENKNLKKKRRSTPSITRGSGIGPTERINPDDTKTQKTQNKIANQRIKSAQKSGNIADFSDKPIEGAPNTKTLIRGQEGETIANPVQDTSKKTAEKTARASTAGTGGRKVKNETKFSKDTNLEQPVKTQTKTRTVKQSEVSKQAQNFTKEINKKNKNRTPRKGTDYFFDPKKARADREKLISKRKQYGIDDKGNISKTGVEKYARQIKQSNLPLTKKDLSTAKTFAVGGEKIKNKAGKVIGTTTGKYGGKLSSGSKYKAPTKTFAQIKAEYADKKAEKKLKSATRKIEKKFAKELPAKQKLAKTFAPATKADRQFFKTTTRVTNPIVKKFAPGAKPVVKKGLKFLTKLGTPGRIAGAAGLALLSPGVRKTVAKVATGAGLGAGLGAIAPKPKKPITPTVKKVGINLSQNA